VPVAYQDKKLAKWVHHQRTFASKGNLSKFRKHRLDEIDFDWVPLETLWEEGLRHLIAYKEREGHCRVPIKHKENGFPLGQWVTVQRTSMETMPALRRQRLDAIGFVWDALDAAWEKGLRHLITYKEREGHCRVPQEHKENGYPLGPWVIRQRHRKENLSEVRRRRLDAIGFVWDSLETAWEKGLRHLITYKEREGHCRVPQSYKENGFRLGQWVAVQRRSMETMPALHRQRLDAIGFVWDPLETAWEKGLRHLITYKEREGHCLIPKEHKENGFPLGRWVNKLRQRKENLSEVRRQRLDELGFTWDALDAAWEEGFRHLIAYKEREGRCRVPQAHKENGFGLGKWVHWQRHSKRRETLPEARRQQLDELGFVWDALDAAWEKGLRHLIAYKEREGHCRVPRNHMENGFRLGQWVNKRRHNQTLPEARRQQLDELGFVWDPQEANKKASAT
jgi:hypothetical protein